MKEYNHISLDKGDLVENKTPFHGKEIGFVTSVEYCPHLYSTEYTIITPKGACFRLYERIMHKYDNVKVLAKGKQILNEK